MKHLQRLLREPLLHFFTIGGLIFALFTAINDAREMPADVIVITPARIDQLAAGFSCYPLKSCRSGHLAFSAQFDPERT